MSNIQKYFNNYPVSNILQTQHALLEDEVIHLRRENEELKQVNATLVSRLRYEGKDEKPELKKKPRAVNKKQQEEERTIAPQAEPEQPSEQGLEFWFDDENVEETPQRGSTTRQEYARYASTFSRSLPKLKNH